MTQPLHLAVALDGAGWHPAAWRLESARPDDLLKGGYWVDLVRTAERGLIDFVTIEDAFTIQSDDPAHVQGRLDAVLIACRVGPVTSHIGIVPTASTTHTEPFHVSKAIATLDHVSTGRAGWRVQVGRAGEASLFGRRDLQAIDLTAPDAQEQYRPQFDEAEDFVEVVRRLWDSWEDDAEIRDAPTGRFVDREKLHYIDFEGKEFSVRGPSITPRPPQGQPTVVALAHASVPNAFAGRSADVVLVTPQRAERIAGIREQVLTAAAGRAEQPMVFADVLVFLDETPGAAEARKVRLDELDGHELVSDAFIFTGTASELADHLIAWQAAGLDGFRLRPGALPHDLDAITNALVPELQERGAFRTEYEATTLRGLLGLGRPASRYAGSPA